MWYENWTDCKRTSCLPSVAICTWTVNVIYTWAKLYLPAALESRPSCHSVMHLVWSWAALWGSIQNERSLALSMPLECLLKQSAVDGTKTCQTPNWWAPSNLEQYFHIPSEEMKWFHIILSTNKGFFHQEFFFFFKSGFRMFVNPLKLCEYISLYMYFLGKE